MFIPPTHAGAQNFGSFLNNTSPGSLALDSLTNVDSTTYDIIVNGPKSTVAFQVNTIKISGTIAGFVYVWGSADGTNFATARLATIALNDATYNYSFAQIGNPYQKYRVRIVTSGTSVITERAYVLYRR